MNAQAPTETWPDHAVEVLKVLWEEGVTCQRIANLLATTRAAVSGKARRLGLVRREPGYRSPAHKPKTVVKQIYNPLPLAEALCDAAFVPLAGSSPVHQLSLSSTHCRWPVGEDLYCGEGVEAKSYCAHHFRMGYRAASILDEAELMAWIDPESSANIAFEVSR